MPSTLTQRFPSLQAIPRLSLLGPAPTPLQPLTQVRALLTPELEKDWLWIKREDLGSGEVGGNKARKLEFLLGQALIKGAKRVITFGMWGSNHALSTALAAKALGLKCRLYLGPQPLTQDVRDKLLALHALDAEIVYCDSSTSLGLSIASQWTRSQFLGDVFFIPPGGSNPLSTLGTIDAFFELAQQLELTSKSKECDPLRIFLPMGTAGTAAGLLMGAHLLGLEEKVEIHAVGIADSWISNRLSIQILAKRTIAYLKGRLTRQELSTLPSTPLMPKLHYTGQYTAPGYGGASFRVSSQISQVLDLEKIHLDQTYTGKAFLAMMDTLAQEVDSGGVPRSTVFWHTYRHYPLKLWHAHHPWKDPKSPYLELPKEFHPLFDGSIQMQSS
jgi:D-cysteine desulfhydrase